MNALMRASPVVPVNGTKVTKRTVEVRPGASVALTVIIPDGLPAPAPCLIYFHGGGFVYGAAPHHYRMCGRIAAAAPCVVILPDYSLAPRHPFPAALEDCFAVLEWAHANAAALGIDPRRIAVGGDSAGGNLAASVCLLARDRYAAPPCFQMLLYPATDRRMGTDSMRAYRSAPMWNARLNQQMWRYYLQGKDQLPVTYASLMESASLAGLPDAYIEVAELDPLRDEGIAYARKLEQDGTTVELYTINGAYHGFDLMQNSETVARCIQERSRALRGAFRLQ
jgi:acetyl esterase/lipase